MSGSNKVENFDLGAKLEIRRRLLREFFPAGSTISVLDCCAGEKGEIWRALRREKLGRKIKYMGLDLKPVGRGVVKFDSARWLREVEWAADVVDIDTYGEPWGHYRAAVDRGLSRLVLFLTYGLPMNARGLGSPSAGLCEMVGIPGGWRTYLAGPSPAGLLDWNQPPVSLRDVMLRDALGYPLTKGYRVLRCLQVCCGAQGSTFYWALRIEKKSARKMTGQTGTGSLSGKGVPVPDFFRPGRQKKLDNRRPGG